MPFRILTDLTTEAPDASGAFGSVLLDLELWPHQSLTGNGFVVVIGGTFVMLCIPLVGLVGTAVLWGVLPFILIALSMLWYGLKRSWHDRDIVERLTVTGDAARLERRDPDGSVRDWEANPYWVRVEMHPKVGVVEDYLTLEGGPRSVEIGAFLTPDERRDLRAKLQKAFRAT